MTEDLLPPLRPPLRPSASSSCFSKGASSGVKAAPKAMGRPKVRGLEAMIEGSWRSPYPLISLETDLIRKAPLRVVCEIWCFNIFWMIHLGK
ncbi:unnamed protein product [Durusdinium trenchii]|uniref:Uncharacterized protein n=1 Tax=Durusdinium trenchii TaxID=1381693 RepID=A0ABP0L228_9DINO